MIRIVKNEYPNLLSAFRLGPMTLKNRVVMLPMGARLSPDGLVSEADVAWLEERARGGVGLIITGGQVVSPSAVVPANMDGSPGNVYRLTEAFREEGIPSQRARVEAVHRHGSRIIGQLVHQGRDNSFQSGLSSEAPILAPSPLRTPGASDIPHALGRSEIAQIVDDFARSAANLAAAGFDGVELHAAHGYLIGQFLSPFSNARTDTYGVQTIENQTRFLAEIVKAIRDRCGRELVLGVRLSADEELPGGLDVEATIRIVEMLEGTGSIDYVSISRATRGNYVKDSSTPFGPARDSAAAVKAKTNLPVIVASRITTPSLADEILARNEADLVGLGRALIADPAFVLKAAGDHPGALRPCVGFVQDCRQSVGGVLCGVNASASRERKWSMFSTRSAPIALTVAVVGGGPGGLEAARVAAEQGHRVVLWERLDRLGGQVMTAAKGPFRGELRGLIDYQRSEIERLGVAVNLGQEADSDALTEIGAEIVVFATGSVAVPPLTEPSALPVVSTWQVLEGGLPEAPSGSLLLVVDDGTGFWPVASATELLADRGFRVQLAGPHPMVMHNIPAESGPALHRRLRSKGVTYMPFQTLARVAESGVVLRDSNTGAEQSHEVAAVIVQTSRRAFAPRIEPPSGARVFEIGDRLAPRRISHAVLEANKAIRSLTTVGAEQQT